LPLLFVCGECSVLPSAKLIGATFLHRFQIGLLVPGLVDEGLPDFARLEMRISTHVAFESPVRTDCLFFLPIPFHEDVRHFTFAAFHENALFEPSVSQLSTADALILALNMTDVVRS
jgi:hypothetical protein